MTRFNVSPEGLRAGARELVYTNATNSISRIRYQTESDPYWNKGTAGHLADLAVSSATSVLNWGVSRSDFNSGSPVASCKE